MAWSGDPVLVTPSDVRRTLKAIADDTGVTVACRCGAARWCPARSALEDSKAFWELHAAHRPKGVEPF